jgi:hypothetical protein
LDSPERVADASRARRFHFSAFEPLIIFVHNGLAYALAAPRDKDSLASEFVCVVGDNRCVHDLQLVVKDFFP